MTVEAMSVVLSRFAMLSDSEMGFFTTETSEAGRTAMEAFVVRCARRLTQNV